MKFNKATIFELPDGGRVEIEKICGGHDHGDSGWEEVSISLVTADGFTHTFCGMDLDKDLGKLSVKMFNAKKIEPDFQMDIDCK